VFSTPQLTAIEVLSSEDRHSKVQARIEDYRSFGVPYIWTIDPIKRIGWDCSDSNWIHKERFDVTNTPIYLSLTDLFRELDAAES
jgi:Uma2 family endonuclease